MSFQPQSRILIMYADTGSGHRSVALAIQCALRALSPDDNDMAIIPLREIVPGVTCAVARLHNPIEHHALRHLFNLYGPVTRRAPRIYAGAYHISNSERVCDLAGKMAYQLLRRNLARLVEAMHPDLIVCVHSLLTHPILEVLQRGNYTIPLFSVVTDLASIHQSWIVPDVDRCFAPTPEVRDEMIRRGMRSERLWLSGLPVHPSYIAEADDADRAALRLALGLRHDLYTVLVMGGGEGIGGLENIARRLAESHMPIQLIVVAGRNPALYRRLSRCQQEWRFPSRVFGYAHNMPDVMRAADVVVTKAGSVTIAEALACGLPIIVSSVIEGQESGNVDYLARHGVGVLTHSAGDVVEEVWRLQQLGREDIRALRQRTRRLSAPGASYAVASHILAAVEKITECNVAHTRSALEPLLAGT